MPPTNPEMKRRAPEPASPQVTARFQDRDALERAVDALLEAQIPPDQIRVSVRSEEGTVQRRIPVKARLGALRGALRGAAVGGVLAAIAVLLLSTGSFAGSELGDAAFALLSGVVGATAAGALAGVTIGGIWSMGQWTGGETLSEQELKDGFAVITVHGDGLRARSEGVLASLDGAAMAASRRAEGVRTP